MSFVERNMEKSRDVVVWSKTLVFDMVLNLWCDLIRNSALCALNWEMLALWALEGSDPFKSAARSIRASDEILWKCWYVTPIYCQLANERVFGCIIIYYQYMRNTTGRLNISGLVRICRIWCFFFRNYDTRSIIKRPMIIRIPLSPHDLHVSISTLL